MYFWSCNKCLALVTTYRDTVMDTGRIQDRQDHLPVTGNLAKTTGGCTIVARVTGITQCPCGGGVRIMGGGNTLSATTTIIITTIIIITVEYNIILRPREPALLSRRLFTYKPHQGPHTKNNMPRAPYNTNIYFFLMVLYLWIVFLTP